MSLGKTLLKVAIGIAIAKGVSALTKGGDTMYSHANFTVIPEYGLTCVVLSSGGLSSYNQMMAATLLEQALLEKGAYRVLPESQQLFNWQRFDNRRRQRLDKVAMARNF